MHILKQKDGIRIKPGIKPTHIEIKGNRVRVGEIPIELRMFALEYVQKQACNFKYLIK